MNFCAHNAAAAVSPRAPPAAYASVVCARKDSKSYPDTLYTCPMAPGSRFLARLASVVTTHMVLGGHMVGIDMESAVSPPAGFQLEVTVFHWG